MANLTDLAALAAGLSVRHPTGSKAQPGSGGTGVVVVAAGTGATLYVAATGAPRPFGCSGRNRASQVTGTLDFTDYDAPLTVAAPAGAIDIANVR